MFKEVVIGILLGYSILVVRSQDDDYLSSEESEPVGENDEARKDDDIRHDESRLPREYYDDYLRIPTRRKLGTVKTQSNRSDNGFLPNYMLGFEIKRLCITSNPTYQPCLGEYELPEFSVPKKYKISYYVWKADKKAAVGFFISEHRTTTLTHASFLRYFPDLEEYRSFDVATTSLSDGFSDSDKLATLEIRSSQIKGLNPANTVGLKKLKKLILPGNNIPIIKIGVIDYAKLVEEIDLSENPLEALDWELFKHLEQLSRLLMNDCKLTEIRFSSESGKYDGSTKLVNYTIDATVNKHIDAAKNLRHLELRNNQLETVEELLMRIPEVAYLDLSGNHIKAIRKTSFLGLRNLKVLLLNGNKLSLPYGEWLHNLVENAEKGSNTSQLDISGNEWKCECQIIAFVEYCDQHLATDGLEHLKTSADSIQCFLPIEMKGTRIRDVLVQLQSDCFRASKAKSGKPVEEQEATVKNFNHGNIKETNGNGFYMDRWISITLICAVFIFCLVYMLSRRANPPFDDIPDFRLNHSLHPSSQNLRRRVRRLSQ